MQQGVQTDVTCNIQMLANNVPSVCTGLYSSHVFITHPPRVFMPQMTLVSITETCSYYVKYFYLTLKWSKILRGNQSDKSSLPRLSLQILFMYFSVWNMKIFSLFKNHLQWALLTLVVCLCRERLYWSEFCWSLQKCDTFTPKATVIVVSITENEVRKAANKLKNSKSPFSDKITNEMINASLDTLMPVYDKLFNSILPLGTMPQTWYGGLITSIYKSGGA